MLSKCNITISILLIYRISIGEMELEILLFIYDFHASGISHKCIEFEPYFSLTLLLPISIRSFYVIVRFCFIDSFFLTIHFEVYECDRLRYSCYMLEVCSSANVKFKSISSRQIVKGWKWPYINFQYQFDVNGILLLSLWAKLWKLNLYKTARDIVWAL